MKVFNKEKVVLNKIQNIMDGYSSARTDDEMLASIYQTLSDYNSGKRYYHKLDGMTEDHVKQHYAHFDNPCYYTEVKEESKTKEYIIGHDVAQVIHEMSKKIDHINEGVGILVLNSAVELIDRGNIKPDELMKILFESLKE